MRYWVMHAVNRLVVRAALVVLALQAAAVTVLAIVPLWALGGL